jgi:hypothetical protein
MRRTIRFLTTTLVVGSLSVTLSGCLIAAVPLVMGAAAAVGGYAVYKTVQTASGGTVRIGFDAKDAKKASPPPALPSPSGTIGVWQGGAREKKFADALQASGKFRVSQVPAESGDKAYDNACRTRRVDIIMAAIDQGQTVKSNMLSFQRGNSTQTLSLQGYSCTTHQVAWTQSMQIIIEVGSKAMAQSEIDEVAGQAWADRVIQAKG